VLSDRGSRDRGARRRVHEIPPSKAAAGELLVRPVTKRAIPYYCSHERCGRGFRSFDHPPPSNRATCQMHAFGCNLEWSALLCSVVALGMPAVHPDTALCKPNKSSSLAAHKCQAPVPHFSFPDFDISSSFAAVQAFQDFTWTLVAPLDAISLLGIRSRTFRHPGHSAHRKASRVLRGDASLAD
jgi:hypothetical protein